jgi:hypothetical protein
MVIATITTNATPLITFGVMAGVSAVYYVAFLLLNPFAMARQVVHETAHDFAPRLAQRLHWLSPEPKAVPAVTQQ